MSAPPAMRRRWEALRGATLQALLLAPLLASGLAAPAAGQSDGDTILDADDNCVLVTNQDQADEDMDGCGDLCDADLEQTGSTGVTDVAILFACFGQTVGPGAGPAEDPECANSDITNDGAVAILDFAIWRDLFLNNRVPGPSGANVTPKDPVACP